MSNSNNRRKKGKPNYFSKYLLIVATIVGSFILFAGAAVFVYSKVAPGTGKATATPAPTGGVSMLTPPSAAPSPAPTNSGGLLDTLLQVPEKTNIIVMGTHEDELLTDTIMLCSFDRDTQTISIISIPRDTYVKMSAARVQALQKDGRHPPSNGEMKINAVHGYAGLKNGGQFLKEEVEQLFNIHIDYYADINLAAFRNIVDTIGGVYFDVPKMGPKGGLYYDDPEQNLHIAVPGGYRLLDGKDAEGLIRWRQGNDGEEYPRADLQRIEVQQQFIKELFTQLLKKETLMKNAFGLASTVINYVKTDFSIDSIPKYLRYIDDLSADKIVLRTLPGKAQNINGGSYFVHDKDATEKLMEELFRSKGE